MSTKSQSEQKHRSNRLINETSTYLLQHAHNPVDWYPWGEEALDRARNEDKPILLSVGYSACHWCHVMEHESFEDEETAELMNKHFVCVKVDREERPDIDDVYMKAVQLLTGHGGWPMTVFITPQLKPFFAGTYFPPTDRHGIPSFKKVLQSVNLAWTDQREAVENSAGEIIGHLGLFDKVPAGSAQLEHRIIENAVEKLWQYFDKEYGGFGGAPKFPHPATMSLLTWHAGVRDGLSDEAAARCLEMIARTLDHMAYGGMYDQLGGGFARYSVDRIWLVPHFEKMLYDNAQLCRNYLQAYQLAGKEHWARVGRETLEFVLREMTTSEGVFYSSLDADSEGEEGKFYVWTQQEILQALGKGDGEWFCNIFGVEPGGNFEGKSILHWDETPHSTARLLNISIEELWARLDPLREKLLQVRARRVRPGRDEKVLLSWNSLMISAFIDGYKVLGDRKYLAVARRAADFIIENMYKNDRLLRTWGRGQAKLHGYLDDYTYFVQALLDLASVDFDAKWLDIALTLNSVVLEIFNDTKEGGLFYTSNEHEELVTRTKAFYDTSTPSPTAVASSNLLRLSLMFDQPALREQAEKLLLLYGPFFEKVPDQFCGFLCALDAYLNPTTEIVFVADPEGDGWEEMLLSIHQKLIPNSVTMLRDASSELSDTQKKSPLLSQRNLTHGESTVYVCRKYSCEAPITDLSQLRTTLSTLGVSAQLHH